MTRRVVRVAVLASLALACVCWAAAAPAQDKKDKGGDKERKVYEVPGGDGLKIEGKLTANDDRDKVQQQMYCKVYLVRLAAGKTYTVRMNARDECEIDAYLRIEDEKGNQLSANDDAPDENTLNSRIDFQCTKDGVYRVIATTFVPNETGDFTVLVKIAN
jgi:hypothetical protein